MNLSDLISSLSVMAYVLVVMAVIVVVLMTMRKLGSVSEIHDRALKAGKDGGPAKLPSKARAELGMGQDGRAADELIAVLAAAAHQALRKPIVIQSVYLVKDTEQSGWATASRVDMMHSHRVGPPR